MRLLEAGRMSTRISVTETDLERASFAPVKVERSDDDLSMRGSRTEYGSPSTAP
jgi:hypothetical protein